MGIDQSSAFKSFIKFFRDHPVSFAKSVDSTAMVVGGKRYQYDDLNSLDKLFDTKAVLQYDLADWWRSPPEEKVSWFTNFVENTYRKEALDRKKSKEELKERLKANGKTDLALPDAEYILTHLQSFRFLGDTRKEAGYHFWDTKTNTMTPYDFHSVHAALRSAHIDKDLIEQFMHQILHAQECYNPHGEYGLTLIPETNNIYQINQYILPEWRKVNVEPELPEEIRRLMGHLFPSDRCQEFVYTWIYHSLTSRAGTYLYLCGGQGSGKNTLANVIAALHGQPNTSNPKQDSILGRFNQYLRHKRFVFFDEFNCRTRQDKDTLKRIINSRVQIEAKHKDHEDIDIHASYFIANNSLEAIGIDPVDRRFSVPDVTHKSILTAEDGDFIPDLLRKLEDTDFVAKFGFWILENFNTPKWGPEEPYQYDRFEEVVFTTARAGIAEVVAKVFNREQNDYSYFEEREAFKRTHKNNIPYPSQLDWLRFFREAKKDGKNIGVIDEDNKFIPADEWKVEIK